MVSYLGWSHYSNFPNLQHLEWDFIEFLDVVVNLCSNGSSSQIKPNSTI